MISTYDSKNKNIIINNQFLKEEKICLGILNVHIFNLTLN